VRAAEKGDAMLPAAMNRRLLVLMAILLFAPAGPLRAAPLQTIEIVTKGGIAVFTVEVAAGDEQIKKGLSGRKELSAGSGMLFDFRGEVLATMNTKDMLIPLDMFFIRSDGRILSISENVEPSPNRQIYSNGMVRGALEVPAGTAKIFKIAVGDRVAHPIFRPAR
jgi:uncharacterized membrane protein (UPF0127 family)